MTTIITAPSSTALNSKIEKMIEEGWKPIGGHTAIVVHSQNRYSGMQHMDTIHETEYSITMTKELLATDQLGTANQQRAYYWRQP